MFIDGIDTAYPQGWVNWSQVKQAGKHFAIIKASEGTNITDPQLEYSWYNAFHNGLPRIAYHFWYDFIDPSGQVDNLHRSVRSAGHFIHGDGMAVDVEEVSVTGVTDPVGRLVEFISKAKRDIAKEMLIYTNYDTWVNMLGNPTHHVFNDCALWLGNWSWQIPKLKQWPNGPAIMQYSGNGHCPGVNGEVDLDRFFGNQHQLRRLLHGL